MPLTKKFQNETMFFRVSTRVKERLKRAAEAREQPVAEFIRLAIVAEITRAERNGEIEGAATSDHARRGDIQ